MEKGGACSQMCQPKRVATEGMVQNTELFTVAILPVHVVGHRVGAKDACPWRHCLDHGASIRLGQPHVPCRRMRCRRELMLGGKHMQLYVAGGACSD